MDKNCLDYEALKKNLEVFLRQHNKFHIWDILETIGEILIDSEDIGDNLNGEEIANFIESVTDKDNYDDESDNYDLDDVPDIMINSLSRDDDDDY